MHLLELISPKKIPEENCPKSRIRIWIRSKIVRIRNTAEKRQLRQVIGDFVFVLTGILVVCF
jgi:hypothetical protein